MSEWRPIETAPKVGNVVLLGNKDGTWVGRYIERFRSGYRPENPWQSLMLNHRHIKGGRGSYVPTHWMPLPDPPE